MTLTIYGVPRSRAIRTLWLANELGIPYTHVPIPYGPEGCRGAEFLAINPNGKMPVIDDDGLVLWESLAINLYLARRHGGPLAPADAAEDARIMMWGFWAATAVEPHANAALDHTAMNAPEARNPDIAAAALAALVAPLGVLEAHLARHGFLVGGRFTVADLNLVCCLFYLRFTPQVLEGLPHVRAYYAAALDRPAARATFALRGD